MNIIGLLIILLLLFGGGGVITPVGLMLAEVWVDSDPSHSDRHVVDRRVWVSTADDSREGRPRQGRFCECWRPRKSSPLSPFRRLSRRGASLSRHQAGRSRPLIRLSPRFVQKSLERHGSSRSGIGCNAVVDDGRQPSMAQPELRQRRRCRLSRTAQRGLTVLVDSRSELAPKFAAIYFVRSSAPTVQPIAR